MVLYGNCVGYICRLHSLEFTVPDSHARQHVAEVLRNAFTDSVLKLVQFAYGVCVHWENQFVRFFQYTAKRNYVVDIRSEDSHNPRSAPSSELLLIISLFWCASCLLRVARRRELSLSCRHRTCSNWTLISGIDVSLDSAVAAAGCTMRVQDAPGEQCRQMLPELHVWGNLPAKL
jgi:hypothetical protein